MLISMCIENVYAKMEKLGLKYVGVQDRALKLCPGYTIVFECLCFLTEISFCYCGNCTLKVYFAYVDLFSIKK